MALTWPLNDLANHIGAILGPGAPVTIDQEMIDHFAALTNDFQWVHVDTERSTREIGGTLRVVGIQRELITAAAR